MSKYKVHYSGFAYVEADSMQDAEEAFVNDDTIYQEQTVDMVEEVSNFEAMI